MKRKEEVIAVLNDSYQEGESDEAGDTSSSLNSIILKDQFDKNLIDTEGLQIDAHEIESSSEIQVFNDEQSVKLEHDSMLSSD